MKTLFIICLCFFTVLSSSVVCAEYERNKAVPVEKVLFGKVYSVRNITHQELIEDKSKGWKVFGGALIGGAIGSHFGSGSGRDVATVLGALLGGSIADNKHPQYRQKILHLVELMIKTDQGKEFMVVQDLDNRMLFQRNDAIRMVYLANGSVRIDKQM
jgi:outer membrane lipoprotein SlyB